MSEISKKQNAFESTFRAQEIFNLVVPHHVENSSISIKGIMTCVKIPKSTIVQPKFFNGQNVGLQICILCTVL